MAGISPGHLRSLLWLCFPRHLCGSVHVSCFVLFSFVGEGNKAWREKEFITDCWLASFQSLSFLLVTAVFLFWFRRFGIHPSQPRLPELNHKLRLLVWWLQNTHKRKVCKAVCCLPTLPPGLRIKQSYKVSGQEQGSGWRSVQRFAADMNPYTLVSRTE